MEEISIPDIRQIFLLSIQTIDTFCTWCEDLEVHINSNFTGFPSEKVKKIMQKLTEYKPNMFFPEINRLFYLLAETMLEVVKHDDVSDKRHVNNSFTQKIKRMTSKTSKIIPIPSVDEETVHQYGKDIEILKKLVKQHQKIYKDIQRQQEVCWIANSKMKTYELYVATAKSSRSHLSNQLPMKELQKRDTAINQLQGMLKERKENAAEASQRYNRLLDTESTTRSTIIQLERKITGDIMYDMIERLDTGLSALKHIVCTKSNERTNVLLSHIKEVESNMTSLAASIIDTLSSKYKCCNPREFEKRNGYSVTFPDCSFMKYKERTQKTKTKKTEEKNNNTSESNDLASGNFQSQKYLKPGNVSEANTTKLLDGMIVKEKISTESSDVVFGWTREKPWYQKKWGFFTKKSVSV